MNHFILDSQFKNYSYCIPKYFIVIMICIILIRKLKNLVFKNSILISFVYYFCIDPLSIYKLIILK